MNQLFKKFYQNIYNILNEITAELSDHEVSEPVNRKRPRYALILEDETWVILPRSS